MLHLIAVTMKKYDERSTLSIVQGSPCAPLRSDADDGSAVLVSSETSDQLSQMVEEENFSIRSQASQRSDLVGNDSVDANQDLHSGEVGNNEYATSTATTSNEIIDSVRDGSDHEHLNCSSCSDRSKIHAHNESASSVVSDIIRSV